MNYTYIALKLHNMKKLIEKIELINSLIPVVNSADTIPVTYAGGTYPYYVVIEPIVINKQFVTIKAGIKNNSFIDGKERYNMNKISVFGDAHCRKHLNYTLNTILKAFKNVTK